MDLKSGYPFWAVKNGLMHAFPRLERDLSTDVVVVGGGITAALIADELSKHDHQVVVIEQRDIGWGSSAASTALIQYEIDTHMVDLAKRYGEPDAALAYRACSEAIGSLGRLVRRMPDADFGKMASLYYASKRSHQGALEAEFALRKKHGLKVQLLGREEVRERFGVEAPTAILSAQAARLDPYCLASHLLARLSRRGGHVFDRSRVEDITADARQVVVEMTDGHRVRAKHVVLAAGYANQRWIRQRVCKFRSSYAYVTDPIADADLGPWKDTMVWESARPYLYMRSTGDGRLILGGEDDSVDVPAKRDARVEKKATTLQRRAQKVLPHLTLEPTFAWAGTFAETKDGLPFFGPHAQRGPRVHFAMAYGGNGITYSVLGAGILRAGIERRPHPLANLFSFARLER